MRTPERLTDEFGVTAKGEKLARLETLNLDARVSKRLTCCEAWSEFVMERRREDGPRPTTSALIAIVSPARAARTNLVARFSGLRRGRRKLT